MRFWAYPALLLVGIALVSGEEPSRNKIPVHGEENPRFARFDELLTGFLEKFDHPGVSIAVGKEGKLLFARAYGYADREAKLPLKTDSLFRISSVTKPLTAVAILQLVERGKLDLESSVMEVLELLPPRRGFDERWKKITIRHLLQHRAGWDTKISKDPMFDPSAVVREMGGLYPPSQTTIIRYMLRQSLDHDPGERFAYSNFGYCLLGRVIEKVTRQSYESQVKKAVLAPLEISRMRLGRTLWLQQATGEVRYHSDNKVGAVMGPQLGRQVLAPYGGFCLETMDSHSGWIASATDLLRFTQAFDDPKRCKLLKAETIETMLARPREEEAKKPSYYALGWSVRPFPGGKRSYWHDGALDGSGAMIVHRADGISFAVLINSREKVAGHEPIAVLELLMHQACQHAFSQ